MINMPDRSDVAMFLNFDFSFFGDLGIKSHILQVMIDKFEMSDVAVD